MMMVVIMMTMMIIIPMMMILMNLSYNGISLSDLDTDSIWLVNRKASLLVRFDLLLAHPINNNSNNF